MESNGDTDYPVLFNRSGQIHSTLFLCMIRTPAHKQTDPTKAAGQIKTLGEYIDQKTAGDQVMKDSKDCTCPQKEYNDGFHRKDCSAVSPLTFEEWASKSGVYYHLDARSGDWTHEKALRAAWDASRANL